MNLWSAIRRPIRSSTSDPMRCSVCTSTVPWGLMVEAEAEKHKYCIACVVLAWWTAYASARLP